MTKDDLVNTIAARAGVTQTQSLLLVNAFCDAIHAGLKTTGFVKIQNFGKFTTVNYAARDGRDPRTGATLKIPARKRVHFSPSPHLHKAVS